MSFSYFPSNHSKTCRCLIHWTFFINKHPTMSSSWSPKIFLYSSPRSPHPLQPTTPVWLPHIKQTGKTWTATLIKYKNIYQISYIKKQKNKHT
jgi:hypothetical protein